MTESEGNQSMYTREIAPDSRGRRYALLPNLKSIRQRNGLSLEELAEMTGLDHSMISKLENQRRGAQGRTVRKLADALGATPADLVG